MKCSDELGSKVMKYVFYTREQRTKKKDMRAKKTKKNGE